MLEITKVLSFHDNEGAMIARESMIKQKRMYMMSR